MGKYYTPTTWVANQTVASADKLNNMENGIVEMHERVDDIRTEFDAVSKDVNDIVANVTNGNINATNNEIVLARKGEQSLRTKIDKIDEQFISIEQDFNTQLEQKADTSMTRNLQTQVNNLVLGAVGDGNNAEVEQARGDFKVVSDRLNNLEEFIISSYYNLNPFSLELGTLSSTTGFVDNGVKNRAVTNFIDFRKVKFVKIPSSLQYKIAFYDVDLVFKEIYALWDKKAYINIAKYPYARIVVKYDDDRDMLTLDDIKNNIKIYFLKENYNNEYKFETVLYDLVRNDNKTIRSRPFSIGGIKKIIIPQNYKVKLGIFKLSSDKELYSIEGKTELINYFQYEGYSCRLEFSKLDNTEILDNEVDFIQKNTIICGDYILIRHYGIPSSTGATDDLYYGKSTNFVKIKEDIKLESKIGFGIRFYDENFNYIYGSSLYETERYIKTSEAKYYLFNLYQPDKSIKEVENRLLIESMKFLLDITDNEILNKYTLKYSTVSNPNNGVIDGINSLMLVACKMKKESNKLPYTDGYLYLDVFDNFKFYYSSGTVENPKYLFKWDATKTSLPPTEYNCFVARNGDVIFAYKSELRKEVRNPAIVYSYPNYEATVISFNDKNNPIGWLQNSGIDYIYNSNDEIIFGEYTRATSDYMRIWKVSKPYNNPNNWKVVFELLRSNIGEEAGLKHIHTVEIDTISNFIYAFTGDDEEYSRCYISKNNGESFELLQNGPEKHLRVLNVLFLKDGAYWGTDGGKQDYHIFCKAKRNSDGVLDLANIEEIYKFPNKSVRFSTYATCLIKQPYGILFLDRFDGLTNEDLPIRFYSFDDKKMYDVDLIKSLTIDKIMYGFRNETVNYYPSYVDNKIICGFTNYPNNMDILNNSYSIVESVIGLGSDYLTNRNKINNVIIEVIN